MWAKWKPKLTNTLNGKNKFHVVLVKPINSNASGNKESEHLKTFHAIWKLIDSMAFIVGVSVFREVKINARMILTASMIFFAYSFLAYTKFVVWPSIPLLLEVVSIYGPLIPVCTIDCRNCHCQKTPQWHYHKIYYSNCRVL